jgi:hemolysin-activating ACP:hemolysin acyltransferase
MPTIITAAQLRSVLGVSSSLYSDAYLEQIIDSAENVILPLLTQNQVAVDEYKLDANIAYFYTSRPHNFVAGQSVVVAGLPAPFAATHTVVAVSDYYFTAAVTNADVTRRPIIPSGTATLSGYSAAQLYAATPAIESAMYAVSIEIFQSRTAAGGQIEGVDFAGTPYRMGRSLLNRVSSLLQPYVDVETIVQ